MKISLKRIVSYIKFRPQLNFVVCEVLALVALFVLTLGGFNPVQIVAMIIGKYDFEIVVLGNMLTMSVITVFLSAYLLKWSDKYIWPFSLGLCVLLYIFLIKTMVPVIESEVSFQNIYVTFFVINACLYGCLVISQAALLLLYYAIRFVKEVL